MTETDEWCLVGVAHFISIPHSAYNRSWIYMPSVDQDVKWVVSHLESWLPVLAVPADAGVLLAESKSLRRGARSRDNRPDRALGPEWNDWSLHSYIPRNIVRARTPPDCSISLGSRAHRPCGHTPSHVMIRSTHATRASNQTPFLYSSLLHILLFLIQFFSNFISIP